MVAKGYVKRIVLGSGLQTTGDTSSVAGGMIVDGAPGYLTAASVQTDQASSAPSRVFIAYGSNTGIATGAFTPDQMTYLTTGWMRGDPVFGNMDIVAWQGRQPLFPGATRVMAFIDNATGATGVYDLWVVVERP